MEAAVEVRRQQLGSGGISRQRKLVGEPTVFVEFAQLARYGRKHSVLGLGSQRIPEVPDLNRLWLYLNMEEIPSSDGMLI